MPISSTITGGFSDIRRGEVGGAFAAGDLAVGALAVGGGVSSNVAATDPVVDDSAVLLFLVSIVSFAAEDDSLPSLGMTAAFSSVFSFVCDAMIPFSFFGSVVAGAGAVTAAASPSALVDFAFAASSIIAASFVIASFVSTVTLVFGSGIEVVGAAKATGAADFAATTGDDGNVSFFWVPMAAFGARFFVPEVCRFAAGANLGGDTASGGGAGGTGIVFGTVTFVGEAGVGVVVALGLPIALVLATGLLGEGGGLFVTPPNKFNNLSVTGAATAAAVGGAVCCRMVGRVVIGLLLLACCCSCLLSATSSLFNEADGTRDNPANKSFPDDAIATKIIV